MVFAIASTFQATNCTFFSFGRPISKFENNQIDFSYENTRIIEFQTKITSKD